MQEVGGVFLLAAVQLGHFIEAEGGRGANINHVEQDGLLKVLHQLYNRNVTSLDITGTGAAKYSNDHFTALRRLIHPSSGNLKILALDDCIVTDNKSVDLLLGLSSLT